jgi:hypothetical protein
VEAAPVQASDFFNPGAKIPSRGKHLWTFYGPHGTYWNHYGDLQKNGPRLGLSLPGVTVSVWREANLKPVDYGMLVVGLSDGL